MECTFASFVPPIKYEEKEQKSSPSKSFILKCPLKWAVWRTLLCNDPSIWRPWLFSDWSALQRQIYLIWNAASFRNQTSGWLLEWFIESFKHFDHNNNSFRTLSWFVARRCLILVWLCLKLFALTKQAKYQVKSSTSSKM